MKILIATDSFKDCLSAKEVGSYLSKGILSSNENFQVKVLPMADGGEGTVEALVDTTKGEIVQCAVHDALMRKIDSFYGVLGDKKTAVIEMAAASGIEHLQAEELNAWVTSTYGTGELILNALDRQCTRIIIGIGGSATNDGGAGMASALGVQLLDSKGKELEGGGGSLGSLNSIDITNLDVRLKNTEVLVACDVSNPLTGEKGASCVYGPQKGADEDMAKKLDANLKHYAHILKGQMDKDVEHIPGAGAAGGLGAGLIAFCDGKLQKGVDIIARETGLDENCQWADVVVTGEGKIDSQTQYGKTPQGVANTAKKYGKLVVAVAGTLGEGYQKLYQKGFDAILSIVDGPMDLATALIQAPELLQNTGAVIGHFLKMKRHS